jgi:pilus assembly protein CpaC
MKLIAQILAVIMIIGLAMTGATSATPKRMLRVLIGEGRLVHLAAPASSLLVADPMIADAQAISPTMIWVFGKSVGDTMLTAVPANGGEPSAIPLTVMRNPAPAQTALHGVARLDAAKPVRLGFAGDRLVLSGRFATLGPAIDATATAKPFVPKGNRLLDLGTLAQSPQITLRVRIAEVSRTALRQLGINWNVLAHPGRFTASLLTGSFLGQALTATSFGAASVGYQGGSVAVNTLVNVLAQHGALRMLAEPNLTTISGEQASFLAGGEIPIPVPQSFGVTTIDYKTYGVSLDFTPTLLPGGRIALHVRPEVSEISAANSVTVGGVSVPAFTTERAETNVEMASGQTVAIAGLFQKSQQNAIDGIPALGNLPVLGALFKSTQFQDNKSELVILITPYLTHPITDAAKAVVPTEQLRAALTQGGLKSTGSAAGFAVN